MSEESKNMMVIVYSCPEPEDDMEFGSIVLKAQEAFPKGEGRKIHAGRKEVAEAVIDIFMPKEERQSNLVDHARHELELLGEEEEVVDGYLKMIRIFDDMGHSGGSASVFIPTINELLQFHNLTELTDDPTEWNHISEGLGDGEPVWQSSRNPEAFSNNGGKTYYLVSDPERVQHETKRMYRR